MKQESNLHPVFQEIVDNTINPQMMSITEGIWEISEELCDDDNRTYASHGPILIVSSDGPHIAEIYSNAEFSKKEAIANAQLIAEAGTVANETGFTPRQLSDQNKELAQMLERIYKIEDDAFGLPGFDVERLKSEIREALKTQKS